MTSENQIWDEIYVYLCDFEKDILKIHSGNVSHQTNIIRMKLNYLQEYILNAKKTISKHNL